MRQAVVLVALSSSGKKYVPRFAGIVRGNETQRLSQTREFI